MDLQMIQTLQMVSQPVFYVKNGTVQWLNDAATYLVWEGQDIDSILIRGETLYDIWDRKGPMQMELSLFGLQYIAKVRCLDDGKLFVLEQREGDQREKGKALMQTSFHLRGILQELCTAGTSIQEQTEENEELIPELEIMNRSVYRLIRLCNQLSDGGALLRGVDSASFEKVNVWEFLRDFTDEAVPLLREAGWELEVIPCIKTLRGDMDRTLISRALYNLLSYGIQHSLNGERISLKAWENSAHVCFGIAYVASGEGQTLFADNGMGIGGFGSVGGVGSDLVRLIAELHGGTVLSTADPEGRERQIIFSIRKTADRHMLRSPNPETTEDHAFHMGLVELSEILGREFYHPDRV